MQRFNNLPNLKGRRKELRRNETGQEKIVWWHLKDRNLGFKFKRQHSIGGYIVDFYCAEKKLVIEIDGGVHLGGENIKYDKTKNSFLKNLGLSVIRFINDEVDADIYGVLTRIKEKLVNM